MICHVCTFGAYVIQPWKLKATKINLFEHFKVALINCPVELIYPNKTTTNRIKVPQIDHLNRTHITTILSKHAQTSDSHYNYSVYSTKTNAI